MSGSTERADVQTLADDAEQMAADLRLIGDDGTAGFLDSLAAALREAEEERGKLREALNDIAVGRWNVGRVPLLTANEFARAALRSAATGKETE